MVGKPGLPGHMPRAPDFVAANPEAIIRFSQLPAVRLLHCLMGVLWTATVPVQLSAGVKKQHPALHRLCGRLFFIGAAAIMAGYVIMEQWLIAEHGLHIHTFYRPLAVWFTYTAVKAYLSAAVFKDYATHGRYCIR